MSVDNEPAGSKEGQGWKEWHREPTRRIQLGYLVMEGEKPIAICPSADEADQIVADHTAARDLQARLNAALEASSIAEAARLNAEARIRELELDSWNMLAVLREAYTQTHDLHHITAESWDIDFVHCSLYVCHQNRLKLLEWGCDVTQISPPSTGEKASTEELAP